MGIIFKDFSFLLHVFEELSSKIKRISQVNFFVLLDYTNIVKKEVPPLRRYILGVLTHATT